MNNRIKILFSYTFLVISYLIAFQNAKAEVVSACSKESYADLVENLLPSVVNISTTQNLQEDLNFTDDPMLEDFVELFKRFGPMHNLPNNKPIEKKALGSGFIIDQDGFIVTNAHVVEDAKEVEVTLTDKRKFKAKIVGIDQKTDLALLKVDSSKHLPFVKFGNSNKTRVGDRVITIGNPFALGGTVTTGIISAKGRDLNTNLIDDFIQTDAAINRGNSGGPMFNMDGEVIGVNAAIYSPSGGSVGIGFAIPASVAKPLIEQLKKEGKIIRSYIGVTIQPMDENIAESLGLEGGKGVVIVDIDPAGPASKSDLKVGDIIVKFDDKEVTSHRSLPKIVAETEIGKNVKINIIRRNTPMSIDIKVLKHPEKLAANNNIPDSLEVFKVKFSSISEELRTKYTIDKKINGVVVTYVDRNSPWANKGLHEGDVVTNINQYNVNKPSDIKDLVEKAKKDKKNFISLLIINQSGSLFFALPLD